MKINTKRLSRLEIVVLLFCITGLGIIILRNWMPEYVACFASFTLGTILIDFQLRKFIARQINALLSKPRSWGREFLLLRDKANRKKVTQRFSEKEITIVGCTMITLFVMLCCLAMSNVADFVIVTFYFACLFTLPCSFAVAYFLAAKKILPPIYFSLQAEKSREKQNARIAAFNAILQEIPHYRTACQPSADAKRIRVLVEQESLPSLELLQQANVILEAEDKEEILVNYLAKLAAKNSSAS